MVINAMKKIREEKEQEGEQVLQNESSRKGFLGRSQLN